VTRTKPKPDYSGTYTLDVAVNCPPLNTFPDSLRRRRYTAQVVEHANAALEVTLSGADFVLATGAFGKETSSKTDSARNTRGST
jgi:hypothetical protein